jgi:hypothetical protein
MAEAALSVVLWRLGKYVSMLLFLSESGSSQREVAREGYLQSVRHVEGVIWGGFGCNKWSCCLEMVDDGQVEEW